MDYVNAFWVGGLICALVQILMEKTKLMPGRIMVLLVCTGAVLGAVSVLLLLYTFINKTDLHGVKVQLSSTGNKRVYLMMGLVVVFCVLISILGFYPAAALMIPAVMRLMDYRNYKVIGLTTVLCLLFIYLVFGMLLHTQMPQSVFME